MTIGQATTSAVVTRESTWSRVTSRVNAYVPITARRVPHTIDAAGEPNSTSATSITPGQPRVYCEKN